MTNNQTYAIKKSLSTAVLFLIFNRLESTKSVFKMIKKAKPPRLYIAADGARKNRVEEEKNIQQVRDYVINNIDWECDVKVLFSEDNLGCKHAVSNAIDWFFDNEEMGIILEDDCLPSLSFFWYCEELLIRYKDDMRVGQICGFNSLDNYDTEFDYIFSKYGPIWGWASWKRAWKFYDVTMKNWPYVKEKRLYKNYVKSEREEIFRIKLFDDLYENKIDTWDFQWVYAKLNNSMLSIVPSKNLIVNIGFNEEATHTKKIPNYCLDLDKKELVVTRYNDLVINDIEYETLYHDRFIP